MTLKLDRSAWTNVKFGDVVNIVNDNVKDPAASGIGRVIGLEHLDGGELAISRWGEVSDETNFSRRVRPGQTLFGKRRAYQRKTAFAEFEAVCSGDILVFSPKDPSVLLPGLLPYIASTDTFYDHALKTSAGSLSPRTRWSDVAQYVFALPPLDQQKRIAELLWAVESSLRCAREVQDRLSLVADSRADQLLAPPPGTETKRVDELCSAITVGIVVKPTQYYAPSGVPALRSLNVLRGSFNLEDLVLFDVEAHKSLSKTTLQSGDVVVVRTGRPGDAAVVDDVTAGYNCIDLIIARPGEGLIPEYLARFLNSRAGRAATLRSSAGTAQQHLNVGALAKVPVPAPSVVIQAGIVEELLTIDMAMRLVSVEVEHCRSLLKSLSGAVWGQA